jgi:hypothetical protein
MYPELAEEYGALYAESFLGALTENGVEDGFADRYMQPDGIHPNAEGVARIVAAFIIGGGINGCGIARDAAGRGLSRDAGRDERSGLGRPPRPRPSCSTAGCAIWSISSSGWCARR